MDTYFPNVEDIVSLARNGTHVPTWGTHPFLNNYEFLQVEILMKLHLFTFVALKLIMYKYS
jgi:hypothetical protein